VRLPITNRKSLPTTHWKRLYAIAWAIWLIDLATKSWALTALDPRSPVKLIGSFLQLTLLKNSGAAFSLAQGATVIFTFFALLVIGAIGYL